jgi:hypothetical protein
LSIKFGGYLGGRRISILNLNLNLYVIGYEIMFIIHWIQVPCANAGIASGGFSGDVCG